jgi:hypothetical protein
MISTGYFFGVIQLCSLSGKRENQNDLRLGALEDWEDEGNEGARASLVEFNELVNKDFAVHQELGDITNRRVTH